MLSSSEALVSVYEPHEVMRFSHVHDAKDARGMLILGNCVRFSMSDASGKSISMLFTDEQWAPLCDDMKAIVQRPTSPDQTEGN